MYEYSSGPLSITTPRAPSQSARSSTSKREGDVVDADPVPVERAVGLALRLPEPQRATRPGDVPDRLAALALDLADAVPAERLQQLAIEGQAAQYRADDEVDVVKAGGAHLLRAP
jgi:hypothetical protein